MMRCLKAAEGWEGIPGTEFEPERAHHQGLSRSGAQNCRPLVHLGPGETYPEIGGEEYKGSSEAGFSYP